MRTVIRRHRLALGVTATLAVAVAAALAFGFFGVQAAFTNTTVSEAGPTFSAASSETETLATGTFAGADASHSVEGSALVLGDGSDQRFLRFSDFEATNGPDLVVYLRAANGEFISLGALKGNIGEQNYEIPASVDLDTYSIVQIWCERFGVNFGEAALA